MTDAPAPVWRGLSRQALDAQYDQRSLVPHAADYMARWAAWSAELRAARPPQVRAYDVGPTATLDVFPGRPGGPMHLHLHGGAWRQMTRADCSFVAQGLGAEGAHVAVADFPLAPAAPLGEIVAQVRRAAAWLAANAGRLGAAPGRLWVSGHSSGAHLAACLLPPDAPDALPGGAPAGLALASGVYDLEPVRLSARNAYLHLDAAEAARLSPIRHLPAAPPSAAILWGDGELDEFRRQSAEFAAAIGAPGRTLSDANHFDVYDQLRDPTSAFARAALDLMS